MTLNKLFQKNLGENLKKHAEFLKNSRREFLEFSGKNL